MSGKVLERLRGSRRLGMIRELGLKLSIEEYFQEADVAEELRHLELRAGLEQVVTSLRT